jgi:probable phosphoglycerate mutase
VNLELTFVRHGQTQWNASRRFQGSTDIPLSEEGLAQAAALGRAFAAEPIDRIYSSDLSRALETARAIALPHGLEVETDRRLREFNFGRWEGLTWDEICRRWPQAREHGPTSAGQFQPDGGESFGQVVDRVRAFLNDVFARPERRVVAVAHAGVVHAALDVLRESMGEGAPDPIGVDIRQASITRVAMDAGRARLITLSDVSHLDSTRR